jgi:uncharacterized membrane protein YciS (DUF1049 family)
MKTSYKLLLGALALIIAGMIVGNFYFKAKVNEIKNQNFDIEQSTEDTIKIDSTKNVIKIDID